MVTIDALKAVGQVTLVAAALTMVACAQQEPAPPAPSSEASTTSSSESTGDQTPSFMFVQTADDLVIDTEASTLRLVDVGQQTLYFSDRPFRMAGHIKMADYMKEWTPESGDDNLGADPPNATLSVYEEGQEDNTVAVVEISNPRIDDEDLVYSYSLVDGNLPATGGATTIFIDRVGPGGGVGAGYHGVGVGARGPGVR